MLPECLRLSKVPAVHCSMVKRRVSLKSRIKTTLPTSGPAEKPPIRKRNSRSMCADFAAHGLSSRESHWFAPVPLAVVQPGPWLRPATTYSPYRIGGEDRRDQANRTAKPKQKHKRIKRSTKPPTKREKREEITGAVCVYCWGRQSSAILSHLSLNGLSHKTKIEKTWLTGRIQQYR